jgi:hypothetical protein
MRRSAALDALEGQAEGLGAAFYWTLIHALYRVMRIYDHSDALMFWCVLDPDILLLIFTRVKPRSKGETVSC